MPLAEHPEMRWHEAALYVEAESIPRLMGWLRKDGWPGLCAGRVEHSITVGT